MPKSITQLPDVTTVTPTNTVPIVQSGVTKETTVHKLLSAAPTVQTISALSIDWSAGASFKKDLSAGGNTFTFANVTEGMIIVVRLKGHASGSTVTWPTVKWPGGTPPTQTSTGRDVYTFWYDGTDIYGSPVQAMA